MPTDPKQEFVCSRMSRHTIAVELNEYLDSVNGCLQLATDDDRLTDALCAKYAAQIGSLDGEAPDAAEQVRHGLLVDMGILSEPEAHDREYLTFASVDVTLTIHARRKKTAGRKFSEREIEDYCGQNAELLVRDQLKRLNTNNGVFEVSLEGVRAEAKALQD